MALRETIDLDVAAARRQIASLESALDSLATTIDIDVSGNAEAEIRSIDDRLDEAVRSADRLSTEMAAASAEAGQAENNVQELARALGISEDRAAALASEFVEAQVAGTRTEDAARDIARQLGLADNEADQFTASLRRADAAAESINVRGSTLVSTFGGVRTAAAGLAGILATIGIGRGIAAAVQGARSAVNEFARLNESVNAVEVTFEEASDQIFEFGQISARSAGLSAQTFQQAVVPIGAVLRNFGFDAREAATASIELVQRAADLASVFNTDVNDALLAINSALVGQVEPLRRYGAEISVARAEQFAFATGLAQTKDDLDASVLTQARLGLILADTNRVAGDFVNTSEDFANASRTAKAEGEEFASTVGEALLPAFESLLGVIPAVLEGVQQLVPGFANAADSAAAFFDSIGEGGGPGFRTFGAAIGTFTGNLAAIPNIFFNIAQGAVAVVDPFADVATQAEQIDNALADIDRRNIGLALAIDLDSGVEALDATTTALSRLAKLTEAPKILAQAIGAYATQAGLSKEATRELLLELINGADAFGFSASEVEVLRDTLALLNADLNEVLHPVGRIGAELDDLPLERTAERFVSFAGGIRGELEELPDHLLTFAEQVNQAMEGVSLALDPFSEAAEPLALSAEEFFNRLVNEVNLKAETAAGLIKLIDLGFEDLALRIGEEAAKGTNVTDLIDSFLGDLDFAAGAEAQLDGIGTDIAKGINDATIDALSTGGFDLAQRNAFIKLLERGLLGPEVAAAVGRIGSETVTTLHDEFEEAMQTAEPEFAATSADSLERALVAGALGMNAAELAAALNIPLQQAALAIRLRISPDQIIFPTSGGTVIVADGGKQFTGGGISGGTTINVTTNYPVAKDPETSIQTGVQLAGAVGGLLTGFGT